MVATREGIELKDEELVHPTGFGVLVELFEDEEVRKSEGGIIMATSEKEVAMYVRGSTRGVVREVGPLAGKAVGHTPETWSAVVGRTVCFARYKGSFFYTPKGRKFIILNDDEIEAWVENKEVDDARA